MQPQRPTSHSNWVSCNHINHEEVDDAHGSHPNLPTGHKHWSLMIWASNWELPVAVWLSLCRPNSWLHLQGHANPHGHQSNPLDWTLFNFFSDAMLCWDAKVGSWVHPLKAPDSATWSGTCWYWLEQSSHLSKKDGTYNTNQCSPLSICTTVSGIVQLSLALGVLDGVLNVGKDLIKCTSS